MESNDEILSFRDFVINISYGLGGDELFVLQPYHGSKELGRWIEGV